MTDQPQSFDQIVQDAMSEGQQAAEQAASPPEPSPSGPQAASDPPAGSTAPPDGDEGQGAGATSPEGGDGSEKSTSGGKFYSFTDGADLDSLIAGDAKVRFTANGEEVEMPLDKAITWAQQYRTSSKAENELRKQLRELKGLEEYKEVAEANDKLIKKLLAGGPEADKLLRDMRRDYQEALTGKAPDDEPPSSSSSQPKTPDSATLQAAGAQLVTDMIEPWAKTVAEAFDAPADEIGQEILKMIGEEPTLDWDSLDDIMNRRIVQALDDAGYMGHLPDSFDSSPWREPATNGQAPAGLRPKGSERPKSTEAQLRAENERLKQQLAEQRVGGAPDNPDGAAPNDKRTTTERRKQADEKNDVIDLTGAESLADVQETLRNMR